MIASRVLISVALVLNSPLLVSTVDRYGELIAEAIRSRTEKNNHLAIATCRGFWEPSDNEWMQHLQSPSSKWDLLDSNFEDMIKQNVIYSVKTIVVVPELGRYASKCLEEALRKEKSFYLVDWILTGDNAHARAIMNRAMSLSYGKSFACADRSEDSYTAHESHNTFHASGRNMKLSFYSQDCAALYHRRKKVKSIGTPIRNKVVRVACYDPSLTKSPLPCYHKQSQVIKSALNFYNATISVSTYPNISRIFKDISTGDVDILLDMCAANEHASRRWSIPPVAFYTYETFYSQRGKMRPVSLFHIVLESKRIFHLVLIVLTFSVLVDGLADIAEFRFFSISATLDAAMVFLASFLANSSAIPRTKRWALSRALLYGFWIVSIFPLSNYIRSELTSRLSVRSPPESIDSLEELEDALDRKRISLCLASNSATEHDLQRNYTGYPLYSKINSLFWKERARKVPERMSDGDCLRCAQMEDHICLIGRFNEWFVKMNAPTVVESVDKLKPIFGITPVGKNCRFMEAYADLLRRTFEGSLRILDRDRILNELRYGTSNASSASCRCSEDIENFRTFFSCFLGIQGAAVAVLVVEILVGRYLKNEKKNRVENLYPVPRRGPRPSLLVLISATHH